MFLTLTRPLLGTRKLGLVLIEKMDKVKDLELQQKFLLKLKQ